MNHPSKIPAPMIPKIVSDWRVLFRPSKFGCYVNDHSVIRGLDGKWHLFGITATAEKPDPERERYFVHAGGTLLTEEMSELGMACNDGTRAWAPGVIRHERQYYMFYGPSPTKLAVSRDLNHWMGATPSLTMPPEACHRDHMVFKLDESTWLLYATGLDEAGLGAISVFVSHDLIDWHFVRFALRTAGTDALKCAWGATESPFVVFHQGWYYLSITYTDCALDNYQNTLLFRSLNPFDFGIFNADQPDETVVQRLKAHAPEYVYDASTASWYITTCGWRGFGIPHEGAVSIAKLAWEPA